MNNQPVTDLSSEAVRVAREIDRLPHDQAAAVYLQKDAAGKIVQVEIVTQERLRLWVPSTTVAAV